MDSLVRRSIDEGHRRLLREFREFGLHTAGADAPDPATLRGAVAFAEDEISEFARWENQRLPPGTLREIVAFEHAFLQQEVDVFARAVRRLLRHLERRGLYPHGVWEEVRHCATRLEVVLELHTQQLRDETLDWPPSRHGA